MQHSIKDDYINSIKNYTNQFEDTNFRRIACNDFKSWPSPREETWRLSRLGSLSRKKILYFNLNLLIISFLIQSMVSIHSFS